MSEDWNKWEIRCMVVSSECNFILVKPPWGYPSLRLCQSRQDAFLVDALCCNKYTVIAGTEFCCLYCTENKWNEPESGFFFFPPVLKVMKSPLGGTHGMMFLLLKSVIQSASLFITSTFLQFLLTWRAYFFYLFPSHFYPYYNMIFN